MKKLAFCLCLLAISVTWLSCYSKNYTAPSKDKFRAVISNSLHPVSTSVHEPALEIMNATTDVLSFSPVVFSGVPDISTMDVSANKLITVVYSPTGRDFALVDNTTEQASSTTVSLPDDASSFFLAQDALHIYAAVPNASMPSGIPGAVFQIDLTTNTISATIPVPHVNSVFQANLGSAVIALSSDSGGACAAPGPIGAVTLINANNIGSSVDPRHIFCGFDHPVSVASVSNLSVFILECGAECGGTVTDVVPLNLINNVIGTPISVAGATVAAAVGSTLYVAGTPPGTPCSSGTAATSCGILTAVDSTGAKSPTTFTIPDGYHDKINVTTDGQVIVGSHGCTEINTSSEIRGCMGILNGTTLTVPPINGDVTGIAPIPGRNVFYAIQGGQLAVYDTTTDKFLPNHQTDVVGQLIDVKVIDNPQ